VQLYGLRSHRNWGIGDFTDLAALCERSGASGAGVVGVSPLHALFPHNPAHASPYSPSSRLFVNALYLDVEAIEDFAECEAARELVGSPAFAARLAALREPSEVDYPGVAAAKREALELVYASFRTRHLQRDTARARAFDAYRRQRGETLERHALHEALQEHCFAHDRSAWGWPAWPERYRHPGAPAVAAFARSHRERVGFFAYLQWQAELQRATAARRARDGGLAIGLYADLAVSVDRGGAESWTWQGLYAAASVGAPPDAFNPEGQNWGLPPIVPSRLAATGFAPFIATLRANMRDAGALRIDHVMALMRLFWVPEGSTPAQGAYVRYPFDELLALLALESHRHRCLVIGEDLGTVPDEVREALAEHDVLSYRVLLFERDAGGGFRPPDAYPERALATASTHDLPTLAGWWEGRDIETRASLALIDAGERDRQHWSRGEDRARLLRALAANGSLPANASADPDAWPTMTAALAAAIQAYLAATPSALVIVQLEDVLLVREQANLPGTVDEHPNWRRKLPHAIDDALDGEAFRALAKRLRDARPQAESP
jgi:(1->4)-alpha-D-glucan 1-alpha-D-glucosylmutase